MSVCLFPSTQGEGLKSLQVFVINCKILWGAILNFWNFTKDAFLFFDVVTYWYGRYFTVQSEWFITLRVWLLFRVSVKFRVECVFVNDTLLGLPSRMISFMHSFTLFSPIKMREQYFFFGGGVTAH